VPAQWNPTHVVPDGGMATWAAPDPTVASDNALAGGLGVEVVEERRDEHRAWVRVRCSNDWTAWVDGALLVRSTAVAPVATRPPTPTGPPITAAPPATPATPAKGMAFFDQLAKPGNGLLAGAVALAAGAAVSYLLWPVLAIPGKVLKDAIPRGNCTSETPGSSGMYFCSVKAGTLTALGPFITVVVALVFRRPIAAQVRKLTRGLPSSSNVLVMPVMATAMFTMTFAAIHDKTADQSGLVPQRMFPALVGLFTFAASRLAPMVSNRYGAAIDRRNSIPLAMRVVIALAIPLVTSYVLTNQERVSDTALKEQTIALLTLGTSYAALVPRDGDFLGAGQRFLASQAQRWGSRSGARNGTTR
jgi:hypothetical protein